MSSLIWIIIACLLMVPGFVGVVIPILPGIPFMFLVALTYAFFSRFATVSGSEIGILLIVTFASLAVDYLAGFLGAKYSGASAKALGAGFAGMLVGLFLFPPFGSFIGLFVGVLLAELTNKSRHEALRAATGSLIGSLAGILLNLLLAILFLALFVVFSWSG